MNVDEEYKSIAFPLIFIPLSGIALVFITDSLGLPRIISQVYAILELPFACYYWNRLLKIRDYNRATGYMDARRKRARRRRSG